jgi:hypothetical protein
LMSGMVVPLSELPLSLHRNSSFHLLSGCF